MRRLQAGALTGTVIDSGDGCTHVVPVSDGHVIASAIQSIPLAGRSITSLVQQLMRCAPDQALKQQCHCCERSCRVSMRYPYPLSHCGSLCSSQSVAAAAPG